MIDKVKEKVTELLQDDNSGHGMDHINRVLNLSLKFALEEKADIELVSLIALLHDVDDRKLFGIESSNNLTNTKRIMDECGVLETVQKKVICELERIGYSKRLYGLSPQTLEGKIVSDADMCDALGTHAILRVYAYDMSKKRPFFDRDVFPMEEVNKDVYKTEGSKTGICHIFEKVLRLKNMMLTDSGYKESLERHEFVVNFLYHFFEEENANQWILYLKEFLDNHKEEKSFKKL